MQFIWPCIWNAGPKCFSTCFSATCVAILKSGYVVTGLKTIRRIIVGILFTKSRGFPHYHVLAKLPGVIDIAMIGRLVQNGRVVTQEMKCGNIKEDYTEMAWKVVRARQIAQRYAILLQESLSTAAFYTDSMPVNQHNENVVINLDRLRREYVKNYTEGNITEETHPLIRKFGSEHCHNNSNVKMAKVAAVCQIHQ